MKNKNRLIASIIVISALATCIHINSFAESGKINTNSVRLRSKANTSSEILEVYNKGEEVQIIEKDGEWYKVKVDGQTGYISADFISVNGEATEKKEEKKQEEEEKKEEPKQEEKKEEEKEEEPKEEEKQEEKKEETKKVVEVKLGKTKSISDQKVYILPNLGASVVGSIKKDAEIDIIQDASGWVYVSTGDAYGWTRYDKIVEIEDETEEPKDDNKDDKKDDDKKDEKKDDEKKETKNDNKTGYISGSGVNLRAKAGKSAEVIDVLKLNTELTIIAEDDEWCKVKVGNQTGYVSKQFVSDKKTETTSRSNTEERKTESTSSENNSKKEETSSSKSSSGVTGQDIVDYAMQFKGYPYVYAAADPSVGFDCSGLAWYVYKHFGYSIERSSRGLATDGKTISNKEDLQPGDVLVFLAYNDYSRVGHVGIYIGNNQFIHANDESTGVIITSLDKGKYPERFVSGRRFID